MVQTISHVVAFIFEGTEESNAQRREKETGREGEEWVDDVI